MNIKKLLINTPLLGRLYLMALRFNIAIQYLKYPFIQTLRWLVQSKETTNFTYDLDTLNTKYLVAFIAEITQQSRKTIQKYIHEIETDEALKQHIHRRTLASGRKQTSDTQARFGRRTGWYAFVRAIKPRVVVETGVDKGLGSCVLTAALKKNKEDGITGYYYGIDIHPQAGFLLSDEYARFGRIIHADAVTTLKDMKESIDLLISDSDHSLEYEAAEYQALRNKMSNKGMILSDNAHSTDALYQFAEQTGRKFSYFQEKPANHWYPGAGIGVAYRQFGLIKELGRNELILPAAERIDAISTDEKHSTV